VTTLRRGRGVESSRPRAPSAPSADREKSAGIAVFPSTEPRVHPARTARKTPPAGPIRASAGGSVLIAADPSQNVRSPGTAGLPGAGRAGAPHHAPAPTDAELARIAHIALDAIEKRYRGTASFGLIRRALDRLAVSAPATSTDAEQAEDGCRSCGAELVQPATGRRRKYCDALTCQDVRRHGGKTGRTATLAT
jgi:hypothetical protein